MSDKPSSAAQPVLPGPDEHLTVAARLRQMAALLQTQAQGPDDDRYRIAAYRHAADWLQAHGSGLRECFESGGLAALEALPTIGPGIAAAIAEMLTTGAWRRLARVRGELDGGAVFRSVPGVGEALAARLHDELGIDTLEALEAAAHDGRLARLPRLGARRAAAIGAAVGSLLDRDRSPRRRLPLAAAADEPPLALLLEVDRDYRQAAAAGTLRTIAPRRFNPDRRAWLPVLHTQRGDWRCTALYSNTARAHQAGREHDWVVIYAEDPQHAERQYTVVTAPRGPLAGHRVVRGREPECQAWYAGRSGAAA